MLHNISRQSQRRIEVFVRKLILVTNKARGRTLAQPIFAIWVPQGLYEVHVLVLNKEVIVQLIFERFVGIEKVIRFGDIQTLIFDFMICLKLC